MPIISSQNNGFSLIELLIALVISLLVLQGVFSIYRHISQTQQFTNAIARIQESGRFAMQFLTKEIRMAGYTRCPNHSNGNITVLANNIPKGYQVNVNQLSGFNIHSGWAVNTPFAFASAIIKRIKPGSDAITVSRITRGGSYLLQGQNTANDPLYVSPQTDLTLGKNHIFYISDCTNTDIFQQSNAQESDDGLIIIRHSQQSNSSAHLSKIYQRNTHIANYQSHLYFVGNTNRINQSGQPIFALYQAEINYHKSPATFSVHELVEGVENMKILYGERLPTKHIKYVTSAAIGEPNNVISIQLGLLIASREEVRQQMDTQTYYLAQQAISMKREDSSSQDKRLRHAFNYTIVIRNRLF